MAQINLPLDGGATHRHPNPPPRPTQRDRDIVEAAAKRLAESLDPSWDLSADDLICCWASEGYSFARALERELYITPNTDLVEALGAADGYLMEAWRAAVASWVGRYGITLDLQVGTHVKTHRGAGRIAGLDVEHATYTVQPPDDPRFANGGGWIVSSEEVHTLETAQ